MSDNHNVEDAVQDVPDYSNFADDGMNDVPLPTIPELKIIQPTTKRLTDKESALFGKSPGLIYNTISEGIGSKIAIVPINIRNIWNVSTRISKSERLFIGSYSTRPVGTKYVKDVGLVTNTGDIVEKGIILTGLQLKGGSIYELMHIRFFSRQNQVGRKIIELLTLQVVPSNGKPIYTPPIYARLLNLSTTHIKERGLEWFDWCLDDDFTWIKPSSRLFIQAKSFLKIAQRFYDENVGDHNSITGELVGNAETLP